MYEGGTLGRVSGIIRLRLDHHKKKANAGTANEVAPSAGRWCGR
jgi:hypothetical protein